MFAMISPQPRPQSDVAEWPLPEMNDLQVIDLTQDSDTEEQVCAFYSIGSDGPFILQIQAESMKRDNLPTPWKLNLLLL